MGDKVSLKTMFLANSGGLSSKRIAGLFGWLVVLCILIASFILEKQIDDFADMVLIMSSSLLGLDTFKDIFQKKVNK